MSHPEGLRAAGRMAEAHASRMHRGLLVVFCSRRHGCRCRGASVGFKQHGRVAMLGCGIYAGEGEEGASSERV